MPVSLGPYPTADELATAIANKINTNVTLNVVAPVAEDGSLCIVRGDDYAATDNRAIVWAFSGIADLTGAAVTLTILDLIADAAILTQAATVADASNVRAELTATETNTLDSTGHYTYTLVAELADGNIVTLAAGKVKVSG